MTTRHDARLEVLLDAVCAFAAALPSETRELAANALEKRVARLAPADEEVDLAIASDLARLFDALGRFPAVAAPPTNCGPGKADPTN